MMFMRIFLLPRPHLRMATIDLALARAAPFKR
jgi:hypothetical protein